MTKGRRALLATAAAVVVAWLSLAGWIDREGVRPHRTVEVEAPSLSEPQSLAEPPAPVEPQSVWVVLGARVEPDGTASSTLRARVLHAVKRLGPQDMLLISGGVGTYGNSEAMVGFGVALREGVSADRILMESASHSTLENARYSIELLRARFPQGFRITLVSDPYHLPRARRSFEYFAGREVGTSPVLEAPRHLARWSRLWWTLREVAALGKDSLMLRFAAPAPTAPGLPKPQ
ncbi:MAG TPA: YdcF family protein [Polyangiaceae bacterium]|nr:YdcF family protein [Polyangiaceae bacterium]